jgi:hypothetical protein
MARKLSTETLNEIDPKARQGALKSALERLYEIDQEIAGIIEAQVKELRDEKSEIKKNLRGSFNITSKLVQARYQSYRIERAAADAEDDTTLDTIREMFELCPVGGQVDMLSAVQKAA